MVAIREQEIPLWPPEHWSKGGHLPHKGGEDHANGAPPDKKSTDPFGSEVRGDRTHPD